MKDLFLKAWTWLKQQTKASLFGLASLVILSVAFLIMWFNPQQINTLVVFILLAYALTLTSNYLRGK